MAEEDVGSYPRPFYDRKLITVPFELKASTTSAGAMKVQGYGSIFDVLDSHGDVVKKGAFVESIERDFPRNLIKFMWQHRDPFGVFTVLKEDDVGLFFEALVTPNQTGRDRFEHIKHKSVDRMSIGYDLLKFSEFQDADLRSEVARWAPWLAHIPFWNLEKVRLREISGVTHASNEQATMEAKDHDQHDHAISVQGYGARDKKGLWLPPGDVYTIKAAKSRWKPMSSRPVAKPKETGQLKTRPKVRGCNCQKRSAKEEKGSILAGKLNDTIDQMVSDDDEMTRSDLIDMLSDAAGISTGTVNQILSGDINCPPIERLEAFAQVLDVAVGWLVEGAEEDGCNYGEESEDGDGEEKTFTLVFNQKQMDAWKVFQEAVKGLSDLFETDPEDEADQKSSRSTSSTPKRDARPDSDPDSITDADWSTLDGLFDELGVSGD